MLLRHFDFVYFRVRVFMLYRHVGTMGLGWFLICGFVDFKVWKILGFHHPLVGPSLPRSDLAQRSDSQSRSREIQYF